MSDNTIFQTIRAGAALLLLSVCGACPGLRRGLFRRSMRFCLLCSFASIRAYFCGAGSASPSLPSSRPSPSPLLHHLPRINQTSRFVPVLPSLVSSCPGLRRIAAIRCPCLRFVQFPLVLSWHLRRRLVLACAVCSAVVVCRVV